MTTKEKLKSLGACHEAIIWAGEKSIQEIWDTCHRGDWMLWLFIRTNPEQLKELTRAKAHCALTVRHLMKDQRSINACEVALKFADGLATREELDAAAHAATYATYAAYAAAHAATYATYAAYAAAYAADAAYADAAYAAADAAYAAAYAAYVANYAADAAYVANYAADAAYAAARIKNQKETADICRKYLPIPNF
jgi:hypothetical protein